MYMKKQKDAQAITFNTWMYLEINIFDIEIIPLDEVT